MSVAYFLCLSQHSGENKGIDRFVIEHNIYSFLTCNFASQLTVMDYLLPLVPDKIRNLPTHMVCTDTYEVCLCEWVGVSNAANTTHAGAWPIGSCHTTSSIWSRIYIKNRLHIPLLEYQYVESILYQYMVSYLRFRKHPCVVT